VAEQIQQFQIAQVWRLIRLFFDPEFDNQDDSYELIDRPTQSQPPTPEANGASPELGLSLELPNSGDLTFEPEMMMNTKNLETDLLFNDINDNYLTTDAVTPLSPLPTRALQEELANHSNRNILGPSPLGSNPGTPKQAHDHNLNNLAVKLEEVKNGIANSQNPSANTSASSTPLTISRPTTPKFPTTTNTTTTTPRRNNLTSPAIPPSSMWGIQDTLAQLLEFYAERGDVQSCVSFCMVLKDKMELPKDKFLKWCLSYIELLQRHKLWTIANTIIKGNPQSQISRLNQQSTTIHTGCPHCRKPLLYQSWACDKCKQLTSHCSLCRQPVKGMYVWCQGCGHGGHLAHMQGWFKDHGQKLCPSGCAHLCTFSAKSLRTKIIM